MTNMLAVCLPAGPCMAHALGNSIVAALRTPEVVTLRILDAVNRLQRFSVRSPHAAAEGCDRAPPHADVAFTRLHMHLYMHQKTCLLLR